MLELPESKWIAKQMKTALSGRKIVMAEAGHTPHGFAFFSGEPELYKTMLEGRVVSQVKPSAGQVELFADNVRLVFNDGTNLRYYEKDAKLPAKHQLRLEFDNGANLICTVQMYGGIHVFYEGENDNFYYLVTKEKPSPLTEQFDEDYFIRLWEEVKPTLSIKAFLATEQRIPGLGNGVLQDILFNAQVNPKSKLKNLDETARKRIYKSVKDTLQCMSEKGGRDTEKDLFSHPGGYESILSKNTWKLGCPVCGGPITKAAYLGGNVYFCPACQPIES